MNNSRRSVSRRVSFLRRGGVSLRAVPALLLLVSLAGCTGVKPSVYCYTGASGVIHSVDFGMQVAGDLYRAGKISEDQKAKLVAAHNVYRPAAQAVVAGCKAVDSQGDADKQIAQIRLAADKVIEALVRAGVWK